MVKQSLNIVIDDDLVMDVDSGVIQSKSNLTEESFNFPLVEIKEEVTKLEQSILDLQNSLDPRTTSRLSESGREGVYEKAGLLTNIVLGIIIALVVLILLI